MSGLGHERKSNSALPSSAFPSKAEVEPPLPSSALTSTADITHQGCEVRKVPNPEVAGRWTAPGAPKSEIQFSCVGGLLTYISFTPRNVSECACGWSKVRRRIGAQAPPLPRSACSLGRNVLVEKRCVDRMIRTGAFVPPAEPERIRLKPSAPVRA